MKRICLWISDEQYNYIKKLDGLHFSEKLRGLIDADRRRSAHKLEDSDSKIRRYIKKYPGLELIDK